MFSYIEDHSSVMEHFCTQVPQPCCCLSPYGTFVGKPRLQPRGKSWALYQNGRPALTEHTAPLRHMSGGVRVLRPFEAGAVHLRMEGSS